VAKGSCGDVSRGADTNNDAEAADVIIEETAAFLGLLMGRPHRLQQELSSCVYISY